MIKKYTTLLIDLDGLLIDSEKVYHEVADEMTAELGKTLTQETITKQMGRSPYESLDIYRQDLGITDYTTQELVDWRDERMKAAYRSGVDLMPGGQELLDQALGKFKLAIATGSTRNLVDIVAEKLNLWHYLDHIQASDEIGIGKPDPAIFLACAKKVGVSPEECIVLEDSSNGCLAGRRAGCYVIAVPSVYTNHQDFSTADAVVGDLFEAWRRIVSLTT